MSWAGWTAAILMMVDSTSAVSRDRQGHVLASHTAAYKIKLVKAGQQEGLRAATGRLSYTFVDRCEGFTVETGFDAQFSFSNGLASNVQQSFAGWEAKDGRRATFRMRTIENGDVTDNYSGTVDLDRDGSGTAIYRGPIPAKYDLPEGSMLASAQLVEALENAARGDVLFLHVVMDGAFAVGPQRVSGVIGPPRRADAVVSPADLEHAGSPENQVWPITMAYFALNAPSETPSYELSVLVRDDGVVEHMIQDFGTYALEFEPESIAYLERDPC